MILSGSHLKAATEDILDPAPEPDEASVDVHVPERLVVPAHGFAVVDAVERISMPLNLSATITGRSRHMRDGVTMPGGFVDPGFENSFALEFFNHSDEDYVIEAGEAGGRLVFHQLSEETDGYDGRWSR